MQESPLEKILTHLDCLELASKEVVSVLRGIGIEHKATSADLLQGEVTCVRALCA